MKRSAGARLAASLAVAAVGLAACKGGGTPAAVETGQGSFAAPSGNAAPADVKVTMLPQGTKETPADQLVANAIGDIELYWKQTFPTVFKGKQYSSPKGGYFSVDPHMSGAAPCTQSAAEITGNAFYCSTKDLVAWDRIELLPELQKEYGDFLIAMVLSHEWGHVIQAKSGVDPTRTIAQETQADCYAGAWTKWALGGQAPHFHIEPSDLEGILNGYLTLFADQVGGGPNDPGAHGNGFDRVSGFQEGYEQGPAHCATFTDDRKFTELPFEQGSKDQGRGGNLPLDDDGTQRGAVTLGVSDLGQTWADIYAKATGSNGKFTEPEVEPIQGRRPSCAPAKAAVFSCDGAVYFDPQGLDAVSQKMKGSDYGPLTLMGVAYAEAVLKQAGGDPAGADGLRTAICLDGAYTAAVVKRGPNGGQLLSLSPGDIDEATLALLSFMGQDQFFAGEGTTGFDRVRVYRQGFTDPTSCLK